MAAIVLEGRQKAKAKWIIWTLAATGVCVAAIQQNNVYRVDKLNETRQQIIQRKLEEATGAQEFMKGQLNTLAVLVGKIGESSGTPSVMKQLAAAIKEINQPAAGESPCSDLIAVSRQERFRVDNSSFPFGIRFAVPLVDRNGNAVTAVRVFTDGSVDYAAYDTQRKDRPTVVSHSVTLESDGNSREKELRATIFASTRVSILCADNLTRFSGIP